MKRVRSAEYLKKQREEKAELALQRRTYAIQFLGGKCEICGSIENLEIDHRDPKQKSFPISRPPNEEAFKEELKKCQLLCHVDHRKKSAREHSGEGHTNSKLTVKQVAYIRSHKEASGRELSELFGVGPMQISRIRRGLRWANANN